jgi:YD repeat-containing protein
MEGGPPAFNYDADNRIVSADAGSIAYTYDGDGNRVVKNVDGTVTVYWRGPDGNTLAESDQTGYITAEYLFFDGKRLARVDNPASTSTSASTTPPAPTLEFYFSDHLGSTGMVTDEEGRTRSFCNVAEFSQKWWILFVRPRHQPPIKTDLFGISG